MSTEINHIDPTYLRTINDGLVSGSLHKDNTLALPAGLVGIYEEVLPPASHVKEKQKFLEFFSAWALLKKEVEVMRANGAIRAVEAGQKDKQKAIGYKGKNP